jgi:branched-subunit amino acid transport protein
MSDVLIATTVIGLGTFAIRASFLLTSGADERSVSEPTARVLRMIPPAALAAIVALQLSDPEGSTGLVARLSAALVAVVVTRVRANLVVALVAGMLTVVVVELLVS